MTCCARYRNAIQEYDQLGPERFFSEHGFGPSRSYELVWDERRYPHKAILGTAYEFATGQHLASLAISRTGRAAPSRCSRNWDSPSRTSDDQQGKADPHVGISAGIGPLCPVRRGRYRRLGCAHYTSTQRTADLTTVQPDS
jgi:hypothetical protein